MANNSAAGYKTTIVPGGILQLIQIDAPVGFFGFPLLYVTVDSFGYDGQEGKVRICIGQNYYDLTVGPGTLSIPGGWTGNGVDTSGTILSVDYEVPVGVQHPTNGSWESLTRPTGSELTVYAYEVVEELTIDNTNQPGWEPNWVLQEDTNFPGEYFIDGDGINPIDLEMVGVFAGKVNVGQSSYSSRAGTQYVGDGGLTYPYEYTGGSITLAEYDQVKFAEIVIKLTERGNINGVPYVNSTIPYKENKNTEEDDKPGPEKVYVYVPDPEDPSKRNRTPRPVVGGPAGGGLPVFENYIALEVNPDPINFANTDVGTQRAQSFTVTNTGTTAVEITSIVNTNPDNPFAFGLNSPNSLPITIEPNETFAGTAFFIPSDDITYTELGYIKSGDTIIKTFNITGTGTIAGNPGAPILRTIALFGDVSTSGDKNFLEQTIGNTTISSISAVNAGSTPIILNSVSLGGAGVFTSPGVTNGFSLLPGESLPIQVSFTPVGSQEYLGTFTLNSNAEASNQAGFNPATGAITCNLRGTGTAVQTLTKIMSFNVQNSGTFEDVIAGGSANSEITATITNIGNSTLMITGFQVESPFTLELDSLKPSTSEPSGFYFLDEPYYIPFGQTSQPFKIIFTPPTATNFVDDVAIISNKTIGPESFEVSGLGLFEVPPTPEEPSGPILPDDEPPPGQEFDPGAGPSSALDGNGSACIPKECEVTYIYEYSANGEIVT
jgi:hypothetical protein